MGTSLSDSQINLPFSSFLNSFHKGEEEDQFLKDSAQDLKNRRNKNKVGLLSNPFHFSRDYLSTLFSFQGQKFGQKRRGGGHHGHGGKRGRR